MIFKPKNHSKPRNKPDFYLVDFIEK